jgi:hypothetical protein
MSPGASHRDYSVFQSQKSQSRSNELLNARGLERMETFELSNLKLSQNIINRDASRMDGILSKYYRAVRAHVDQVALSYHCTCLSNLAFLEDTMLSLSNVSSTQLRIKRALTTCPIVPA